MSSTLVLSNLNMSMSFPAVPAPYCGEYQKNYVGAPDVGSSFNVGSFDDCAANCTATNDDANCTADPTTCPCQNWYLHVSTRVRPRVKESETIFLFCQRLSTAASRPAPCAGRCPPPRPQSPCRSRKTGELLLINKDIVRLLTNCVLCQFQVLLRLQGLRQEVRDGGPT